MTTTAGKNSDFTKKPVRTSGSRKPGPMEQVKKLWDKHVGWKGGALIRTLFSLTMCLLYGETAFVGALVTFFRPDVVDAIQPHFEKGIQKAQDAPLYVWGVIVGVIAILYVGEPKDSHYFESVMTIVNLFCYVLAAQVGADLASRNIARAQISGIRTTVNNATKKLG